MKKGDSLTEIGSLGVICGQLKHVNKQKIGKRKLKFCQSISN